jgi:predicted dienelactone hydrolase
MTLQFRFHRLLVLLALAIMAMPGAARAAHHEAGLGLHQASYVDETRAIKKSGVFPGSDTRRIDVTIWYPAMADGDDAKWENDGPFPLIVYSHGTFGFPENATHLTEYLARHGYVVAAINFPLSSRSAFTQKKAPDTSDVGEQIRDISFVIDSLLADSFFAGQIDPDRIGTTGHSLGAITSYFASFGKETRDPRIKATAPIAAGDPIMAASGGLLGVGKTTLSTVSVPVLFFSAEKDVFARMTGAPLIAYSRLGPPRYELIVRRGNHVWFRDGDDQPADNKNPDCFFFEKWTPGMVVPGCEERVALIGPARQQEITRAAMLAFFDAYLKEDKAALERLHGLGEAFGDDVRLVYRD